MARVLITCTIFFKYFIPNQSKNVWRALGLINYNGALLLAEIYFYRKKIAN